jgi:hypothetical protein
VVIPAGTNSDGSVCPSNTYSVVTGSINPQNGTFSVTASSPAYTYDKVSQAWQCEFNPSFTESETLGGLASCNSAFGSATYAPYLQLTGGNFPNTWSRPATAPDGETSPFTEWDTADGLDVAAEFSPILKSTAYLVFGGRNIIETQVGGACDPTQPGQNCDTCYFKNSEYAGYALTPGDGWQAQDDNTYGIDYIYVTPSAVAYLQTYGPANWAGRTSCTFTATQQMQISTDRTDWQSYGALNSGGPNTVAITINAAANQAGVTISRGDNGGSPAPTTPTYTFPVLK